MAAKHWAIGCGTGCLLLLLGVAVVVGFGAKFVGDTASGFEDAVETKAQLDERYSPPAEYVPPADPPGADRMEVFLTVREASGDARRLLAARFSSIPITDEQREAFEKKSFFGKLGAAVGMAKLGIDMGRFFAARNAALLENGMGFGEYVYLYTICYHGWLRKDPGGDMFSRMSEVEGVDADIDETDIDELLLPMIRRQLEAMGENADPVWRARLEAELEAGAGGAYLPWRDGLPESVTAAFEPLRERAEAAYDPIVSGFELMRNQKRGEYSYTVE